MELCTTQAITNLPNNSHHRSLPTTCSSLGRTKTSLYLRQTTVSRSGYGLRSRTLFYTDPLPRAIKSEETSSGSNPYISDKRDAVVTVEDVQPVDSNVYNESVTTEVPKEESPVDEQTNELLDNLNIKFDTEDAYSVILYGSSALVLIWLASTIVSAIDSIPLFPKLLQVVGLGYTFWFSTRYLLFKENREELSSKIEELKQQVLGTNDD
ncbi:protein CURVATURE THYLAKOID 1D, chloroplastic-like [Mangifera indica]|uniref:protein CURVATURE THYLAKOID 1D, chloroplastic-like n=1 Tax=Mangifera indica TaxID=29780 RepID=UPI001CFB277A|nr:protein CURVATURE THYLAKOID 1D, chloroplastic-like [Mangifera indica]